MIYIPLALTQQEHTFNI